MTSIVGLPTRGSDVTVYITKVHLHPLCVLVEFWGKFSQDSVGEYRCLASEIQSPGSSFQESEGTSGDQCLAQIDETWYRARIVSRNGSKYSVFLIDQGITFNTSFNKLAWGKEKHFRLPPEVEFCVLANVLPLSLENRWTPVALEFLHSLTGKSAKAHVQDVLLPHRTFVIHIPCISKQMYEMGIARGLSPDMFLDFVLKSLQSEKEAKAPQGTGHTLNGAGERLHKKEVFMYPELQAGIVETVIVSDVTSPQRIFCQLKVFSQELKKLSEQITQCCEGRMVTCLVGPEMIGFPCAARGTDGRWYRSVLQQIFPTNQMVEVLNVDYGTKQFVKLENVRPLAKEFFRMPVVTYNCSLHGLIDKGVAWTTGQIDFLKTLLLNKTVIAKFEYHSISEGLYYVTLYGDENTNINKLFVSNMSCSLEVEKALPNYAIHTTSFKCQHPPQQEGCQRRIFEKGGRAITEKLPAEELSVNSSHVAFVQHATDPSEFWIQTQRYANELDELMDQIYHLYKDSGDKDGVKNPTVGLYCAAKAEDGDFYRATVTDVCEEKVKVFFVDYGNTEVLDRDDIRLLPEEFKKLPCLGLKCMLSGIRPKDKKWSPNACEVFIKAVKDKELNVLVKAKYDESYAVQLADPVAQGEKDLASLMCDFGHAEREMTQRPLKAKMLAQTAILPTAQLPKTRLSGVDINKGSSLQTVNAVGSASIQGRTLTFKEHMFPTGSVLDVCVSYIESPNDFWCQLVQNTGLLKMLMHDIQAYYDGSEFQSPVETACIARHPDNKMWYRALVIHRHETRNVDVLFVDYGQTETVSLYDLRRICPQFLTLQGQAFRCSLLNPIEPTSATNEWNDEAIEKFYSFVESAASNFLILKCTIYAVMFSEQKILFNIVDLETPFESVSTSMANILKSAPLKKAAGPSFRLDSYYYSTHNVKTGTEEEVTVTCVNNVRQFYCQLKRNADVIKDLTIKVNNLCHQLEKVKLPAVFGALCFARYTDGQWYRGQIKATKPAILVQFVDYGDTIEVGKSDLLPVPREANDIMSVPVQAIVCSLSDIPANVPSEVNTYFETSSTDTEFRALVVAREPDGKLQVELYQRNVQINSKIKKMFQIEMQHSETVVYQDLRTHKTTEDLTLKNPKTAPSTESKGLETHPPTKNLSATKPAQKFRDADKNLKSRSLCENGQKVRTPMKLYQTPQQRKVNGKMKKVQVNGSEPAVEPVKPKNPSPPTETEQLVESSSPPTDSHKNSNVGELITLANLPSKSITSGMEVEVYISQCNSSLSFYVQLVREEEEMFSLADKLNDPKSIPQTNIKDLHPGVLVQAEFVEDSSWYRAVVKKLNSDATALVEFVDFGNTAVLPVSKIGRLHESFLQLPRYSTHCMLSHAATLGEERVLDPEVVSAFKEDVGGTGEKHLMCKFIRQSGSVWEVSLRDGDEDLVCKAPSASSTDNSGIKSVKLEQIEDKTCQEPEIGRVSEISQKQKESCSLCYPQQKLAEGQKLMVFITATNDDQTFWCQPADSQELDKITADVAEVGDLDNQKDIISLSPGSPCIALFSDDDFWYRAEVIDKEGDQLSVLFVDYGNKSKVNASDVREIPHHLASNPPLAFLCKLEGLDASNGSWDSGMVDELSALSTDNALQLTVKQAIMEEGGVKYLVQLECEGQVMNETLKSWWRITLTENDHFEDKLTKTKLLQCDHTAVESALSETLPESNISEIDTSDACVFPPSDHAEDQSAGEPDNSYADNREQKLTSSPEDYQDSVDYVHSESLEVSAEEESKEISSEGNVVSEPLILDTTESLTETTYKEQSKEGLVPMTEECPTKPEDFLSSDNGVDKTLLLPKTDKDTEEEVSKMVETFEPGDASSQLDKTPTETVDQSSDLVSMRQETDTSDLISTLDETTLATETSKDTEEEVSTMVETFEPADVSSQLDKTPTETVDQSSDLVSLRQETYTSDLISILDETTLATERSKDTEEEVSTMVETFEPADIRSSLDKTLTETVDESTDRVSLRQETYTSDIISSLDETSKDTEEEVSTMVETFEPADICSSLVKTPSESVDESSDRVSMRQETYTSDLISTLDETTLATETSKDTEEEVSTMVETFEPADVSSQLDKTPTEAVDQSSDLVSLRQETYTSDLISILDETTLATERSKDTEEEVSTMVETFEPADICSSLVKTPSESVDESSDRVSLRQETYTSDLISSLDETTLATETSKDTDEEVSTMVETFEPGDTSSQLDKTPTETVDESSNLMSPQETVDSDIKSSLDEPTLATETSKDTEEEEVLVMDTTEYGDGDRQDQLDKKPTGSKDKPEITTAVFETPPDRASTIGDSHAAMVLAVSTGSAKEKDDKALSFSVCSTKTVKMVPRVAALLHEKPYPWEISSKNLKQNQTDPVEHPCLHPASDSDTQQELVAESGVSEEDMSCVAKRTEDDLMEEEEETVSHEDKFSDPVAEADSEKDACSASSRCSESGLGEVTCPVEEECFTEVYTDQNEPCEEETSSTGDDCLSFMTAEEMGERDLSVSCSELSRDQSLDPEADTDEAGSERDLYSAFSHDLDDGMEEGSCPVEETCLTDVCTGPAEPHEEDTSGDDCPSCIAAGEMVQRESPVSFTELPRQQFIEMSSEEDLESRDVFLQDEALCSTSTSVTEEDTMVLPEDELSALLSDSGPQDSAVSCPDLSNLVEEVTCLVGEICLTDICRDSHRGTEAQGSEELEQNPEAGDGEELVQTPHKEKEDLKSVVKAEDTSSGDTSAQQSQITHLCLKITDGSPAEGTSQE